MSRVLLIVPSATYRAKAFLEAAARLGVEVVIGCDSEQALAKTMGDSFLRLRLDRPEVAASEIAHYASRHPIDSVIAVDDQGSLTAALASTRLGLTHSSPEAVAATRDKLEMRRLLLEAGVPQARYAAAGAEPGEVARSALSIGFPVVIKPRGLSGSRGVIRADDESSATAAADRIRAILEDPLATLVVEEFIPGAEIAIEGLVRHGTLEILAIFDKPDPLDGPYFEETIYVTPSQLGSNLLGDAARVTAAGVRAIGVDDGPIHAEVRIMPDADRKPGLHHGGPKSRLIEVAARTIGGRCSKVLTFTTGKSLEELVLLHSLGLDHDARLPEREQPAAGVMMIPIAATGTLSQVTGRAQALAVRGVTGIEITAPLGRQIRALPEGDRYLGFIFASGDSPRAVEAALRQAHRALTITIAA